MKRVFLFLVYFLISLSLTTCSYQKRIYRKGYYVEWLSSKSKKDAKKVTQRTLSNNVRIPLNTELFKNKVFVNDNQTNLLTHSSKKVYYSINRKIKFLNDTCRDKILLKSGDDYFVKVIEVTDNEIKYRRCDNLNGPLYSISKSKVYMIEYANGVKEHIIQDDIYIKQNVGSDKSPDTIKSDSATKTYPDEYIYAILFFVLSFITLYPLIYVALYIARKAKRKIIKEPNRYKGLGTMNFIMYASFIITAFFSFLLFFLTGLIIYLSPTPPLSVFGIIFLMVGIILAIPIVYFLYTNKEGDF